VRHKDWRILARSTSVFVFLWKVEMNTKDYSGIQNNGLTIKKFAKKKNSKRLWSVQCVCGNIFVCNPRAVIDGNTKSCGCLTKTFLREAKTKHGCSDSKGKHKEKWRLYRVWANMLNRCRNPKSAMYHRYGKRGVKVCKRWHKFENFLNDNSDSYTLAYSKWGKKTQIDRINNDGNYTPSNCRWVSRTENSNNKSTNVFIVYKNKKYTIAELTRIHGIHPETFKGRLKRGCTVEQALTTPLFCRKHLVSSKNTTF